MAHRSVFRELAAKLGIELRPRSEWSIEQKVRLDMLMYGTAFVRQHPDGTAEHIPAEEMVVHTNGYEPLTYPGLRKR